MRCIVSNCDHDSRKHSKSDEVKLLLSESSKQIAWLTLKRAQKERKESEEKPGICTCHFLREDIYVFHKHPTLNVDFLKNGIKLFDCMIKPCNVKLKRLQYTDIPIKDDRSPADCSEVEACRICLATDVTLYYTPEYDSLERAYKTLTGVVVNKEKYLPPYLCQDCARKLINAAQFRSKAIQTSIILGDVASNHPITLDTIKYIRRNFLKHNIGTSQAPPENYEMPIQFINQNNDSDDSEILVKPEHYYINDHYDDISLEVYTDEENVSSEVKTENNDDNSSAVLWSDKSMGKLIDVKSLLEEQEMRPNSRKRKKIITEDLNTSKTKKSRRVLKEDQTLEDKASVSDREAEKGGKKSESKGVKETGDGEKENCDEKDSVKKPVARRAKGKAIDPAVFTMKLLSAEQQIAEVQARQHTAQYETAPYKCTVCYRGFKAERAYETHMLKHDKASGDLECAICHIRNPNISRMRHHMTSAHSIEYSCKLCKFVSKYRKAAAEHQNFHAGVVYKCPHCDMSFRCCTTYKNHMRIKHPSEHACPLCGYMFASERGVVAHRNLKHRNEEGLVITGPYCETCDVGFATQAAYDRHLKLSSKHCSEDDPEAITNDPQCMGKFKRRVGRKKPPPKEKSPRKDSGPVQCEQCNEVLKNYVAYAAHFRLNHPAAIRTQFPERCVAAVCELCGTVCRSPTLLMCHMWNNHGVGEWRPLPSGGPRRRTVAPKCYDCPICNQRFVNKYAFQRHVLNHTGQRPFQCTACPKGFKFRAEQIAHFEHVHLNKPWPKKRNQSRRKKENTSASDGGGKQERALVKKSLGGVKKKVLKAKKKVREIDNSMVMVKNDAKIFMVNKESLEKMKRQIKVKDLVIAKNELVYEVPLVQNDASGTNEERLEDGEEEGDLMFYDELWEDNENSDAEEYKEEVLVLTENEETLRDDEEASVTEEDEENNEGVIYYEDEEGPEEKCVTEIVWEDEDTWREPNHD